MKPSAALRLGCQGVAQERNRFNRISLFQGRFKLEGVCANTAILRGYDPDFIHNATLANKALDGGEVREQLLQLCPAIHESRLNPLSKVRNSVYEIVFRLNDDAEWSFEQIAVWLEGEGL